MCINKKKIVVGLSGGVDSSVAALRLREEGYDVIGVHLVVWKPPSSWDEEDHLHGVSTSQTAEASQAVAERLGIPCCVVNVADEFKKRIVEPFVQSYLSGKTPNPCVVCNDELKLEVLLAQAAGIGAEHVATGHYARVEFDLANDRYVIRRGIDSAKDQSYYLGRVKSGKLPFFKTPLGNLTKKETRAIAIRAGLPTAVREESQEICFIPCRDYRWFLRHYAADILHRDIAVPGPIYDVRGKRVGNHNGLPFYTIGQRKGLGISSTRPLFVIDIQPENNALIVGGKEYIAAAGLLAEKPNWVSVDPPDKEIDIQVQIRYRHPPAAAQLDVPQPDKLRIQFSEPQLAVTPGQLSVFYRDDVLLGSAFISETIR